METPAELLPELPVLPERKYLTYKEWKLNPRKVRIPENGYSPRSKYLTYKEWKHHDTAFDFPRSYCHCKYLTYKEWKPVFT